jgi:hypothetical protein
MVSQKTSGAKSVGIAILIIIFFIGAIMMIHALYQEFTIPILERDVVGVGNEKLAGAILMVIPVAIGLGIGSGTGRPYGGRRFKGLGGINITKTKQIGR